MRFITFRLALVWICAAALGTALLLTSQNVQDATGDLNNLERAITIEQEALAILSAEWGYLNAPQRLERLAQDYFGMDAPGTENLLVEDETFPFPSPIQNAPAHLLRQVSHEQKSQEGSDL